MAGKKILISGGGIAGLTLGILLKEKGWNPLVIERDASVSTEGYMMHFFGTGWDVAERMGIIEAVQAAQYPIDAMEYVDTGGRPYLHVPVGRVRNALSGKYTYLRRSDLQRILYDRAMQVGLLIRFSTMIRSIEDTGTGVTVTLEDGRIEKFDLVIGADGVHSRVRELVFGPEQQFSNFLGYYVAAFRMIRHECCIDRLFQLYEEVDCLAWFYPLNKRTMDAIYVFRSANVGFIPSKDRLALVRKKFKGAGWIARQMLKDYSSTDPAFFDSMTQIVMQSWSKGRVALIGDSSGCLTLLAAQGSHMAMAGAYVMANELAKYSNDHRAAFKAYEKLLRPETLKKQKRAAQLSKWFVPLPHSNTFLRRTVMKLIFSKISLKYSSVFLGDKSALANYH